MSICDRLTGAVEQDAFNSSSPHIDRERRDVSCFLWHIDNVTEIRRTLRPNCNSGHNAPSLEFRLPGLSLVVLKQQSVFFACPVNVETGLICCSVALNEVWHSICFRYDRLLRSLVGRIMEIIAQQDASPNLNLDFGGVE